MLTLVNASINFAHPPGPFDDPALVHRASCNASSFLLAEEEVLLPMFLHPRALSNRPIGFLRPNVVEQILQDHERSGTKSIWNVLRRSDDSVWAVCFADCVDDFKARSYAMKRILMRWKTDGIFKDILKGWNNEVYPVYTPRQEGPDSRICVALGIERAALPLFGFANFGCLLTAFYDCPTTGKTMLWISRRSLSKSTWPGRYDCTVGGGMGLGESPKDTIVRECAEEASLPCDFVRRHVRSTGMLNYTNRSPEGWMLPGIYYLYELRLPRNGSIKPRTNVEDGEVDSFQLMSPEEVLWHLRQDQFKPSSAMVLVDFCIRRGVITPESEPRYLDICMALRRPVVLPLP